MSSPRCSWNLFLSVRFAIGVCLSLSGFADAQDRNDKKVTPLWSQTTLKLGDQTFPLLRELDAWKFKQIIGDDLIRCDEAHVEAVDRKTGKTRWKSEISPAAELTFLAQGKGILYFTVKTDVDSAPTDPVVRRLQLEDGTWLKPLVIPLNDDERAVIDEIPVINQVVAAHPVEDGVIVLSTSEYEYDPVSYRISKFQDQLAWSKVFPSRGALSTPSAWLLGSSGPAYDFTGLQRLTSLGALVVVCAGPTEDLVTMDPGTGDIAWQIPRIWEYRKGFIGPSVWRYFLERYGLQDHEVETASRTKAELLAEYAEQSLDVDEEDIDAIKAKVAAAKQRVEKQPGWIVAGPVVVPNEQDHARDTLFLATARSESSEWPNYLAECIVFEISPDGTVIATVTLPSFLQGKAFHVFEQSLFWLGEDDKTARLFPSDEFGPRYLTIDIDWRTIRTHPGANRYAWLKQGLKHPVSDFHGRYLLQQREESFVEKRLGHVFHYPLALIDLVTLEERELMLDLPFTGQVEPPTPRSSEPGGGWVTGPFLMVIDDIEFEGEVVSITFEYEERKHVLEFDLSSVLTDQE